MRQIIGIGEIEKLIKQIGNKRIVLVGGCFDVVHLGHIVFLEKAKLEGDVLVILLESDKNIRKNKGQTRPINNQENRAILLTKLRMVDFVIKLPEMEKDEKYLEIIKKLRPKVIAISKKDENLAKKRQQAEEVGAKLIKVTNLIPHQSTSRIIEIIKI